jgi:hypothetical protein
MVQLSRARKMEQMKNVAILTGSKQDCGIYYYARNLHNMLTKSKHNNYLLFTCDSESEMQKIVQDNSIDVVIHNWHPTTMRWLNQYVIDKNKVRQFMIIGHEGRFETIHFHNIEHYITIDVTAPDTEKVHPGVRPIVIYEDIQYSSPGNVLKIGTSGIGQHNKNLNVIIDIINRQFNEPVELNVHFSPGFYTPLKEDAITQLIEHYKKYAKSNVKINYTLERFSEYDLIKWLNNNDINIYYYETFDAVGVSGSTDRALSARKPIGVNTSNFFRHIISDDINIEKTPIKEIVAKGLTPLSKYYTMWNSDTLLAQYDGLVNSK